MWREVMPHKSMSPLKWTEHTEYTDKHYRPMPVCFLCGRLSARFPLPQAESFSRNSVAKDSKEKVPSWFCNMLRGMKQKVGTNVIFAIRKRLQKLVLGPAPSKITLNDLKVSRECSDNLQMILTYSWQRSKEK